MLKSKIFRVIAMAAAVSTLYFSNCGRKGDAALLFQMERSLNQADRLTEQIKIKGPVLSEPDFQNLVEAYAAIADMTKPPSTIAENDSASEERKQIWALASLALTRIAGLYLDQQKYDQAYDYYKTVADDLSTTPLQRNSMFSYMALSREKAGKYSEASALYDSLAAGYLRVLIPDNPNLDALDAPLKAAEMWQKAGEEGRYRESLDKAIRYYNNLISEYAGTLTGSAAAGKAAASYLQQGRYSEAISTLKTVRDDSTGQITPGVMMMIAEIYFNRLGDFSSAEKAYGDFIRAYPENKDVGKAKLGQGLCLYQQGKYVEARKVLQGVEKIPGVDQKTAAQAYYLTAMSYEKEDKWELAKGQYDIIQATFSGQDEGFEAALHVVEYYRNRGLDKLSAKAFENAVSYINKIIKLNANNPEASARASGYLVRAYTENGDLVKAAEQLELLHELYPQFPEGRLAPLRLADIYENVIKDKPKAASWLKIYIDENPNAANIGGLQAHLNELEGLKSQQ